MYMYKNPIKQGYTRVKLTKQQHIEIFGRYSGNARYEYYENNDSYVLQIFEVWYTKLANIIAYPLILLFNGIGQFNELNKEVYQMLFQKKTGHFVSDIRWKKNINKIKEN